MANKLMLVQAEAKKLKANNKKLTHSEALKKAWAIVKKMPVKKVVIKKKVGATKQTALEFPKPKKVVTVKAYNRKANHVPAGQRHILGSTHLIAFRDKIETELKKYTNALEGATIAAKQSKTGTPERRNADKYIKQYKTIIATLKAQLRTQNTHIAKSLK